MRNEAMVKAMSALNEKTSQFENMVCKFENYFFIYGHIIKRPQKI